MAIILRRRAVFYPGRHLRGTTTIAHSIIVLLIFLFPWLLFTDVTLLLQIVIPTVRGSEVIYSRSHASMSSRVPTHGQLVTIYFIFQILNCEQTKIISYYDLRLKDIINRVTFNHAHPLSWP